MRASARWIVLLLAQFLEAGQEALIKSVVRLSLALELLLLGLYWLAVPETTAALSTSSLSSSSSALETSSSARTASVMRWVSLRSGHAPRELVAGLHDLGMVIAQARRGLGHLADQLDVLDAQGRQRGVARHLGDVGDLAGIEACPAQRDQARLRARCAWCGRPT